MKSREFALTINTDLCGECIFCVSVCPYEALTIDPETKKVVLAQDKCKLCGICYATCPSALINIEYYNIASLGEHIKKEMGKTGAQELTIACRGTGLTSKTFWKEASHEDRKNDSIFLGLPCLGRININLLMQMIEVGIQKINLIACEEDYCRYKDGSRIGHNKFEAAQIILEDIGCSADMIDIQTRAPKVNIDESKCITCGTCAFLCPYKAIRIEQSARLNKEKCKGCGICISSCPAIAVSAECFDFDTTCTEIEAFAKETISPGPKIIVMGCQWSEYRYADEESSSEKDVRFISMPCSGRIDVLHILKAFSVGIDGILISMCLDDLCNLEDGSKRAQARVAELSHHLEKLGLNERVKTCLVHPKYIDMFKDELTIFIQKINELRLSPVGRRV
ncbi:TPA: hypothetical protein DCX15_02345 [bacterium]|nr:hypothetical protein [bacterium]